MQINTVMSLNRGGARVALPNRPSAVQLTKLSKEEMHKHGKLVEYRHRVSMLSADLESAVQALSAANEEIAALRKEIAAIAKNRDELVCRLEGELKTAKDRLAVYESIGADFPAKSGKDSNDSKASKASKARRQKKTEPVELQPQALITGDSLTGEPVAAAMIAEKTPYSQGLIV